jgi:hypothetical protein
MATNFVSLRRPIGRRRQGTNGQGCGRISAASGKMACLPQGCLFAHETPRTRRVQTMHYFSTLLLDSEVLCSNRVQNRSAFLRAWKKGIQGGEGGKNRGGRPRQLHDPGIQQEPLLIVTTSGVMHACGGLVEWCAAQETALMRVQPVARPAMAWPRGFPHQRPCFSSAPCATVSQQGAKSLWVTLGADRGAPRLIASIVLVVGHGVCPARRTPWPARRDPSAHYLSEGKRHE